jgi:hypothetical protein
MHTHAHATHPRTRSAAARGTPRVLVLRAVTRRLADWWNDDAMSARFSAARERDQRLLRRVGSR